MDKGILIYGFIGMSGFTLITIGAWQSNEWMIGSGISLLTFLIGKYTDSTLTALKKIAKGK